MTQINDRKEPTFGKPKEAVDLAPNQEGKSAETAKVSFSLHSNKAPGYTFTPVMKRPAESTDLLSQAEKTLEEQVTMKQPHAIEDSPTQTSSPKPNGGFTFSPVKEENAIPVKPDVDQKELSQEQPKVVGVNPHVERVIPNPNNVTNSAKEKVEKIPSKYRRLLLVLLLLLSLLLALFLLKPKTPETAENLQEQGSSLPIEFRPVNEEEAKRAEEQAKALQAKEEQANTENNSNMSDNVANITNNNPEKVNTDPKDVQPTIESDSAELAKNESVAQSQNEAAIAVPAVKPVVIEVAKKPEITGSVIHQVESTSRQEAKQPTNKPVQVTKVEPKVAQAKQPAVTKAEKVVASTPEKTVVKQPVKTIENKVSISSLGATSKALTVPKGVSLMQLFRENQLNISDVNAMSKANNIVSNLKAGEKITVQLDKNNRVTEMKIGSGGRFIRQANGSYIYK